MRKGHFTSTVAEKRPCTESWVRRYLPQTTCKKETDVKGRYGSLLRQMVTTEGEYCMGLSIHESTLHYYAEPRNKHPSDGHPESVEFRLSQLPLMFFCDDPSGSKLNSTDRGKIFAAEVAICTTSKSLLRLIYGQRAKLNFKGRS